jgi:hypothetical protein
MSWTLLSPAWRGSISVPKSIPRHSTLVNLPATLCPMRIAAPLTLCLIKTQRSIDHLIAGESTDGSVPPPRTRPSWSINGVGQLSCRGKDALEIATWPQAHATPVHPTNPLNALGHMHIKAVGCKIDLLENADADCLARLIQ